MSFSLYNEHLSKCGYQVIAKISISYYANNYFFVTFKMVTFVIISNEIKLMNREETDMELLPEIQSRQSIKSFSTRPIEEMKLNRIIEAARIAPSAKNRQPWRFIIINDEDLRKKIQNASFGQDYVGQAPIIIAAASTNIDYRMPNGQLSYPIDIAIAVSFMMIQAEHEELGSSVVTTFDEREVKELLTIPYSMKVVMLLLLGYPESRPLKVLRKPIEQISSYNHW